MAATTRINCNALGARDRLVQRPLEAMILERPVLNVDATRRYILRKTQAVQTHYMRQRFGRALFTGR